VALIACPECGSEVSDKAPTCPKCGVPIAPAAAPSPPDPPVPSLPADKPKARTSPFAWVALILIIAGAVWYLQTPSFRERNLPPIPIDVKYRKALFCPGLVLDVANRSGRQLTIVATFKNPTTNRQGTFQVNVAPNNTAEVGCREGWAFASGDTIRLSHKDYQSWNGNIP
jgi:zinc ribbon protein